MKTEINELHIDLKQIAAIGPMRLGDNRYREDSTNKFIFMIYFTHRESLWVEAIPDVIDKFQLETKANDVLRAKARAAYDKFVSEWKGVT